MNNSSTTENHATISKQFEEACADFQVPATRAAAEQILSEFRRINNVLPICQHVLEHTESPMVQFQVSLAIIDVVVREYTLYEASYLSQLKHYLLDYCLNRPTLMKYARDQLVLASALITKRSLFDISAEDREAILVHITQLIHMESESAQVLGLALSSALIDQFANVKSTTIGLSWEYHHKCKIFFETDVLLQLLQQVLGKLHAYVNHCPKPLEVDPPALLTEMIVLVEKILHWEFVLDAKPVLAGTFSKEDDLDDFDREDGPSSVKSNYVTYPKRWQPVIGHSQVLWLFFMTYAIVKDDDILGHRCRQCLIQLSGFRSDFFNQDIGIIRAYAETMIHGIRQMINNVTVFGTSPDALSEQGPQMLGTIQITRRLIENTSIVTLCSIPDFFQFLNEVGLITVSCLAGTVVEVDEGWISESCDECLQTWVKVADIQSWEGLGDEQRQNITQYLTHVSYQIVETYVNTRLEHARAVLENEEEEDEIDTGFKDWDTYGDQLTCIGTLARISPEPCLGHIYRLFNERYEQFKGVFIGQNVQDVFLTHEQIHWIILITAHILADAGIGEQPMIPESVMRLSASKSLDQDVTVHLSEAFIDLFRFMSSFGSNTVEASNCSPRVAETLIWYFERWSKSYLLIDENEYNYTSPNIAKTFGRPGPSDGKGIQVINFFIEQMKNNFVLWNADPDVLCQLVQWLKACGTATNMKQGLLHSAHFPLLVEFLTKNVDKLPEVVHSSLIQTLATISSGAADETMRNNYFGLMFNMMEERLGSILHDPEYQKTYQNGEVVNNVMNALEMFDGLALSCQFDNTKSIFQFCSRFFDSFIQLMNIYKSVSEAQLVILQLFSDLLGRLDFGYLEPESKQMLFSTTIQILQSFGASNQGKKRMHTQEEEEDQPYADIATVLSMLTNTIASGTEDVIRKEQGLGSDSGVADVVLFGINIVIPMIDLQMLKIPALCRQYVKLISHLIEIFPNKLAGLPPVLFNNLMASLQFGVQHDIPEINILTLRAIIPLTIWAIEQQRKNGNIEFLKPSLQKFLEILLNNLLFQHLDTSVLEPSSEALLVLVHAQRDVYTILAHQIISQQTPEHQERLYKAFTALDAEIPQSYIPDRNSTVFIEALLSFLMNVRAILRVK
ncbi:armadillo-type protein [Sporodiniella umbellata]|nr:armadillo-type protein [Sporodiniella umbellata]